MEVTNHQYITAHCGKLITFESKEELNFDKLRCPYCNKLINED